MALHLFNELEKPPTHSARDYQETLGLPLLINKAHILLWEQTSLKADRWIFLFQFIREMVEYIWTSILLSMQWEKQSWLVTFITTSLKFLYKKKLSLCLCLLLASHSDATAAAAGLLCCGPVPTRGTKGLFTHGPDFVPSSEASDVITSSLQKSSLMPKKWRSFKLNLTWSLSQFPCSWY